MPPLASRSRICFSCSQPPVAGFPLPRCTLTLRSTCRQGRALPRAGREPQPQPRFGAAPPPQAVAPGTPGVPPVSRWTGRKPQQHCECATSWASLCDGLGSSAAFLHYFGAKKSPSAASSAGMGHHPLHIAAWDTGRAPTSAWGEPAGGFIRMELVQIVLKLSKSNNGVCI